MRRVPVARLRHAIATWPAGFAVGGATRAERWGVIDAPAVEREFEALALDLAADQMEHVEVYRRFAAQRPTARRTAAHVPALPVEAFKHARVAGFPQQAERLAFHTSGTSGASPGVLSLEDPSLYDLSLERAFQHHVLPDCDTIRILVAAAGSDAAPHSSLSYMFERVVRRFGAPGSGILWTGGGVDARALRTALEQASERREPVCLLGTAFTWVQLADACDAEGMWFELPQASRLLETGGYKGRSRTLSRSELVALVTRVFGIAPTHVVSEYGMTEMASQYYTTSLRAALLGTPLDDVWSHPAWLRPRVLDSETGLALELNAAREDGLLAHHDLANLGSVAHLLSSDLGRPRHGSFELLGRCPHAEPRGCGLAYESA